jgi:hypothetical protein
MTPAITENTWQGLIACVLDAGEQPIAGVNDTGDKHSFAKKYLREFSKKF